MAKNVLIFIDTNIFLDIYSASTEKDAVVQLEKLESAEDKIITTCQVEMEYKKNRQKKISDARKEIKSVSDEYQKFPTLLAESKAVEMIKRKLEEIKTQQDRIKKHMDNALLLKSASSDIVYHRLQKLFKKKSDLHLSRDNKIYDKIYDKANKRFLSGYPPRKKSDTSMGDAINWEWIVKCANEKNSDVVVVSRDNDYGITHNKKRYINDWLKQEFKERVSNKKNITLTDRMMDAFEDAGIKISKEEKEAEDKTIENLDFSEAILTVAERISAIETALKNSSALKTAFQNISALETASKNVASQHIITNKKDDC